MSPFWLLEPYPGDEKCKLFCYEPVLEASLCWYCFGGRFMLDCMLMFLIIILILVGGFLYMLWMNVFDNRMLFCYICVDALLNTLGYVWWRVWRALRYELHMRWDRIELVWLIIIIWYSQCLCWICAGYCITKLMILLGSFRYMFDDVLNASRHD